MQYSENSAKKKLSTTNHSQAAVYFFFLFIREGKKDQGVNIEKYLESTEIH